MESYAKVLCQPCYDGSFLSTLDAQVVLATALSHQEWVNFFQDGARGDFPDWFLEQRSGEDKENETGLKVQTDLVSLKSTRLRSTQVMQDQLSSPVPSNAKAGLILEVPTLSFDLAEVVEIANESNGELATVQQVADLLKFVFNRFSSLKSKWTKAFQEVEATYLVLTTDMSSINAQLMGVMQDLGAPPSTSNPPFKSVWEGLGFVQQSLHPMVNHLTDSTRQLHSNLKTFSEDVTSLSTYAQTQTGAFDVDDIDDCMSALEVKSLEHDRKFGQVLQFVRRFRGTGPVAATSAPPSISPQEVTLQPAEMQAKLTHLEQQVQGQTHPSSAAHVLDETVRDVKGQLKLLQQ